MLKTPRPEEQESEGNFTSTKKPGDNYSHCMCQNYDLILGLKSQNLSQRHLQKVASWCKFTITAHVCDSSGGPPDPQQDGAGLKSAAPDAALCENRLPLPRAPVQS